MTRKFRKYYFHLVLFFTLVLLAGCSTSKSIAKGTNTGSSLENTSVNANDKMYLADFIECPIKEIIMKIAEKCGVIVVFPETFTNKSVSSFHTPKFVTRKQLFSSLIDTLDYHKLLLIEEGSSNSCSLPISEKSGITKCRIVEKSVGKVETDQSDMKNLVATARIVPSYKNGKSNGFRIYSIKPGSPWNTLGFKNGDIIQYTNKIELNSPESMLKLLRMISAKTYITIQLLRRGNTMTIAVLP